MNATEAQLQEVLNSPNRYIVPVFQRYYTWEKKNWEQLWQDIEGIREKVIKNPNPTHFMGSLVFISEESLPNKPPTFQIIDGQQRMMTLTILLCALRNISNTYGYKELAEEINDTLLIHPHKKGLVKYRVYPRHQDKEDFEILILGEQEPENRIGKALTFFERKLLESSYLKKKSELETFLQLIISGLEFVLITIDQENPYQIFKSLNSTGVDLGEGDLIRNYVFMHLPIDEQDEFDRALWLPLEYKFTNQNGILDGNLISSFFRDFLMRNGNYVRQTETYSSFEGEYQSGNFSPKAVTKDFHKAADIYNIIRGKESHSSISIEESLIKLRELDSSTAYPLVLKLMLMNLNVDDLKTAIDWISSFILRRYVCRDSSRAYARWFVSACNELDVKNDKNPLDILRMFLVSKGFPNDKRFEDQFMMLDMYNRRYAKAIISRIEKSLGHHEPVDLSTTQIEHIMPRTLNEPWVEELGPNSSRIYETYIHTIGNLTLTGYNQDISNKPFTVKREEYRKSNIGLTKMIAKYDKWDEESIIDRGKYIIALAKNVWKAPESTRPSDSCEDEEASTNGQIEKLRKMLSRKTIPKGQKDLYEILSEAGENGISRTELGERMNRSRNQMAGVLGALGVRINKTHGLDDDQGINHVVNIWEVNGERYYRMKPEFQEALRLEGIIS